MDRRQSVNRLEFHNDAAFDQKIEPITHVHPDAFVDDRQAHLLLNLEAALLQFVFEAGLISVLQQSRPED